METTLPTGTVTFLFTDVEGSTRLLKELGQSAYLQVLERHRQLLREAFSDRGGVEVDTQGDALFVAFPRAKDAVLAASAAQVALTRERWSGGAAVRVRMGIHTGEATLSEDNYVGLAVHRGARICAHAHGGQVLLSQATAAVLEDEHLELLRLGDLGPAELKDFDAPVHLYEIHLPDPDPIAPESAGSATRIQICGRLVATIGARRVEDLLPGRQGRLLFVYLVCNRLRSFSRAELIDALWPDDPPEAADTALSALLSKLRRAVGSDTIEGRSELRLSLPRDAFVDFEAATEALHRAESAVRRSAWADAWGPARVALHTAGRGFLVGERAPWVEERRRQLDDVRIRAHECVAATGLGLGGAEIDSALRSGRALVELAPLRESGYRLLMQALAADGNAAEALGVYDILRLRLREELGAAPSPATQELHRALLG